VEPAARIAQRFWCEATRSPLRIAAADDQPCPLQHLEVPGDGGQAHLERRRELVDRRVALGESGEDGTTNRVGEGGERLIELFHWHLTPRLINKRIKQPRRGRCQPLCSPLSSSISITP